jgi:ubiquinone/menaquinone biosynthesis C-methylase UbiE
MKDKEIAHYGNETLWKRLSLSETNRERIQKTVEMIPKDVNSIADIGCGSGLFLNYIKENRNIPKLIGIDFSEDSMKMLKTDKKVGDITNIPLQDSSYDLVCALEVLEHLDLKEYKKGKEELARVAKKYILISVPFAETLEDDFVKCPECKTHFNKSHHKRTFDEQKVKALFESQGFRSTEIRYISKRNMYFILTPIFKWYKRITGKLLTEGIVCPVCGYEVKKEIKKEGIPTGKKRSSAVSNLSSFLKKIWPKKHTYKWIASLYAKID